jgi:ABC-type lipoprotein export system ATPase subunit
MNDPRGSIWRRWDLHVHTPASIVQHYGGDNDAAWGHFIEEIEGLPSSIQVLGINDYVTIDGYVRLLKEKSENGRLENIIALFPVIELRMDKFGGTESELKRANYHIIFSPKIRPEIIKGQFLAALSAKYTLDPEYEGRFEWSGLPCPDGLEDLGKKIAASSPGGHPKEKKNFRKLGFDNLNFHVKEIEALLNNSYFNNRCLTAVGKAEWSAIKWNDQSIADKKTLINKTHAVFTASPDLATFTRARNSLAAAKVNRKLLDCSDAHYFSDSQENERLGNSLTWIKADPSFEGLRLALKEYDERIFVGTEPPALQIVRKNKTKFLKHVAIHKNSSSELEESWFNTDLDLNNGFVAIIGNKGSGKSALSESIGLVGNSRQEGSFTFLNSKKFREPQVRKAQHFDVTITWESTDSSSKNLAHHVDETQPETVKYLPQNYLEKICNEVARGPESAFDVELQKVIFSHIPKEERLKQTSLDKLIQFVSKQTSVSIKQIQSEISNVNERIVDIEKQLLPKYRSELAAQLKQRQTDLKALLEAAPKKLNPPKTDSKQAARVECLSARMEKLRKYEESVKEELESVKDGISKSKISQAAIQRAKESLNNIKDYMESSIASLKQMLAGTTIDVSKLVTFNVNEGVLGEVEKGLKMDQEALRQKQKDKKGRELTTRLERTQAQLEQIQNKMDEPNREYQEYLKNVSQVEDKRKLIEGDVQMPGTIKYLEAQIKSLEELPNLLKQEKVAREEMVARIFEKKRDLVEKNRQFYIAVQRFIDEHSFAADKFGLNFQVEIVCTDFVDLFLNRINHGKSGSFYGKEDGRQRVEELLDQTDFNETESVLSFLRSIDECLHKNFRGDSFPSVPVESQLKKGQKVTEFYDFLYSLNYLMPRFALRMGDKELHQLSPGEKGLLLLVFYLLVDQGDIPLIIDQPEENLDNETVHNLLVPCLNEAKKRRQIIIVTHNPNLAVVCDAEQVIYAALDKQGDYSVSYESGGVENPRINKRIVDILEGTLIAFNNRDGKYQRPIPVGEGNAR